MKQIWFSFACLFLVVNGFAQQDSKKDTPDMQPATDIVKTGWGFGALPVVAYDSDIGFKYGALANFYFWGNGIIYPKYYHSFYVEWSQTTKGSGISQFIYDSEYLIPNTRLTFEVSNLTEKSLDFYGFNGYAAKYRPEYEDENSDDYISRVFYRHERDLLRIKADFQGNIIGRKLRWLAGYVYYNVKVDSVDVNNLNKGKSNEELIPYSGGGLYGRYIDWGIINKDEKNGGQHHILKIGLVFDTRDNEPNPMRGIWSEAMFLTAPSFLGNKPYAFSKLILTHRQYFTIIENDLNFAYRISYQAKIAGDIPFYMLPFVYDTRITYDGLGGAKTLRGVLRNRVVGESMLYGTAELRWKVFRFHLFKQNFYIALSGFLDFGMVTNPRTIHHSLISNEKDIPHFGYGGGFHVAMNQNFIVTANYGLAAREQDGTSGVYIGLNFLY